MQPEEEIVTDDRGSGEVWITINRPRKHNALAKSVIGNLGAAIAKLGKEPATRCIIIRGAGDRFFAAGGDLVELSAVRTREATVEMCNDAGSVLDAIRSCPVPVIAYVNGDAIGGGAELAVSCDMRMLASHARIGFVQGKLAITSAWGGGPDLCQLVGSSRAMRMMTRCELIGAELASEWGLVDAVVTGGADGADVRAFLSPLLERSPLVLRSIKELTAAWRKTAGYSAQREIEQKNLVTAWLHDDHWAASDRFLQKEK